MSAFGQKRSRGLVQSFAVSFRPFSDAPVVSEERYGAFFPGHERVPSDRVGRTFAMSVEGAVTGQVIIVE